MMMMIPCSINGLKAQLKERLKDPAFTCHCKFKAVSNFTSDHFDGINPTEKFERIFYEILTSKLLLNRVAHLYID